MQSPGPTPDLLSQSLHLAEVSRGSGCCGFAKPGGIPNPAEPSAGPTGLVSREAVGFAHRDGLCRALMSGTENPALAAASEARGAGSPGTCQNTLSPGPAPDLPGLSVGWGLGAAQAQGTLTDSRAPDTLPGSTGTRRRGGRRALPRGTAVRAASAQGGLRAGHGPPPGRRRVRHLLLTARHPPASVRPPLSTYCPRTYHLCVSVCPPLVSYLSSACHLALHLCDARPPTHPSSTRPSPSVCPPAPRPPSVARSRGRHRRFNGRLPHTRPLRCPRCGLLARGPRPALRGGALGRALASRLGLLRDRNVPRWPAGEQGPETGDRSDENGP